MFKKIEFKWLGNGLILDTNHLYCDQMNLAFPIENIRRIKNLAKTVMPHNGFQIFTDVIHFHNLSLVTSKNYRAILQTDKMAALLQNLEITLLVPARKEVLQNLSLRDDTLTYTDKGQGLLCRANPFMRNLHQKMSTFMTMWL